jgi:hypothetical protein
MSGRNYNPALGLPYTRVSGIAIDYRATGADVTLYETQNIVAGGQVLTLEAPTNKHQFSVSFDPAALAQNYPLLDYGTGEASGKSVTLGEVVNGLLAIIRAKQLERDA